MRVYASADGLTFGTDRIITTHRALGWKLVIPLAAVTFGRNDLQYLRNDLTALFDQDRVAEFDIEPFYLILVMEGSASNHSPGQKCWLEISHWRQSSCSTDLNLDVLQFCCSLPGRIFVCDRPSGRFRCCAEIVLQRGRIDLYDHTVDLIIKRIAQRLHLFDEFTQFFVVSA